MRSTLPDIEELVFRIVEIHCAEQRFETFFIRARNLDLVEQAVVALARCEIIA